MNRQALHIDELSAELAGCKQQLAYYKSILESPEGIIVFSLDREYRYTSFTSRHASVMQEIWGQSIAVGRSILEIITADDDRLKAQQNFDAALAGEYILKQEAYGDIQLGRRYWENRYSPLYDANQHIIGVTVFVTDITQQKSVEEALYQLQMQQEVLRERESLLNSIGEGVYGVDLNGLCTFVNPSALEMLGFDREEFLHSHTHTLIHHHYPDGRLFPVSECIIHHVSTCGEQVESRDWLYRKNGELLPVRLIATPILKESRLMGTVIAFSDITSQLQLEEQLLKDNKRLLTEAAYDRLTGIKNRRYFEQEAEYVLSAAIQAGMAVSALMLDIDHFKAINDRFGHGAGDQMLVAVAQNIRASLRSNDLLARLGGEEFAVLLPNTDKSQAVEIAGRILDAVRSIRISYGQQIIQCTISIGISKLTNEKNNLELLVRHADEQLYIAKQAGRDCIRG